MAICNLGNCTDNNRPQNYSRCKLHFRRFWSSLAIFFSLSLLIWKKNEKHNWSKEELSTQHANWSNWPKFYFPVKKSKKKIFKVVFLHLHDWHYSKFTLQKKYWTTHFKLSNSLNTFSKVPIRIRMEWIRQRFISLYLTTVKFKINVLVIWNE